jgi:formyltetrahydrofolate-dependent phosphoribosylglycinamide formyltransferase
LKGIDMKTTRIAVLLSGSGTTLQNLLDLIGQGKVPAEVVVVGSSIPGVFGLERAQKAEVPHFTVDRKAFPGTRAFSDALWEKLEAHDPDLVILAGFIHLLHVPDAFAGKVMNVHPALIPAFCGKGYYYDFVHEQVLDRGAKVTGCTVHFVDNVFDNGPIILQKTTPVHDDDTVESLKARVQALEREAYPEAVTLFAEGRLRIEGRRVFIADKELGVRGEE